MNENVVSSHVKDPARLAALRKVALLDTPTEEAFDRLSRLAAQFTNSPVALVSLVDSDRQFFKSCIGLPEPWNSIRETPLSHSFCQYNHVAGKPLIVKDARKEPLFKDNLAIRDLNVVAYLGIPLTTSDAYVLGSFCVIDSKPRSWTARDVETIQDLASAVMTEIELRSEITKRLQAEEELSILKRAIEQGPSMIIITDSSGIIEYVNPAFYSLSGYNASETLGKKPNLLKSGYHDDAFYRTIWRTIESGNVWKGEICNQTKNGAIFWQQTSISPVINKNREITHYISIQEDITQRKELERLKDDVERIMRHDIKQPLTSIIGYQQLLLGEPGLTDNQKQYCRNIEKASQRMLNMINFNLNILGLEAKSFNYSPVSIDLIQLMNHIFTDLDAPIKSKKIDCVLTIDQNAEITNHKVVVQGDETLSYQLFSNLIKNAVEASPDNQTVQVNISEQPDSVTIQISNQDVVPEEIRKIFFEKYVTHGKSKGTGLGTYSAKLIVEKIGGTISMQTHDDQGTRITVNIPG